MKRRDFLGALGSAAAAWPLAARAQQSKMPAVGYLSALSVGDRPHLAEAFRQGLNEIGYAEGRNVTIQYRYADNQMDRLKTLAADLIASKVAVIAATGGNNSGLVAKSQTSIIPIVFTSGSDPVSAGLVASLNRPEANVTGVSWFNTESGKKHVELLHELVPSARLIAVLINPYNNEARLYEPIVSEAVRALGLQLFVVKAGNPSEIDTAFTKLAEQRADAVIVGSDAFYTARASQFVVLTARHGIPAMYSARESVVFGGLLSYGNSIPDAYRRAGNYTGRILKGVTPADLPIDRATKFEFVINLATARALGLTVPPTLLARADEVIE
jgi:putative ABC transport system substrate-binding protein